MRTANAIIVSPRQRAGGARVGDKAKWIKTNVKYNWSYRIPKSRFCATETVRDVCSVIDAPGANGGLLAERAKAGACVWRGGLFIAVFQDTTRIGRYTTGGFFTAGWNRHGAPNSSRSAEFRPC